MGLNNAPGIHWSGKGGTVVDVYGERKYNEVMEDTWGHLKPEKKKYKGWLVVIRSAYGDILMADWYFEDLQASPWQFDHFNANIDKWVDDTYPDLKDFEPGIYIFEGIYEPPYLEGVWQMFRFSDIIANMGGWDYVRLLGLDEQEEN